MKSRKMKFALLGALCVACTSWAAAQGDAAITPGDMNPSVFTTVNNQQVLMPKGVTERDLKHVKVSTGVIDSQTGDYHKITSGTADMTPEIDLNTRRFSNQIRELAAPDRLNVPELQNFEFKQVRDWNIHQWTTRNVLTWHSAIVVEIGIDKDYLQGIRAVAQLDLKAKELYGKDTTFSAAEEVQKGIQRDLADELTDANRNNKDLKGHRDVQQMLKDLQYVYGYEELSPEEILAKYPAVYSADEAYARMTKEYADNKRTNTAEGLNKDIQAVRVKLIDAANEDINNLFNAVNKKASLNNPALTEEHQQEVLAVLNKYMENTNVFVDDYSGSLVTTRFGKGQYSETRLALIVDGFEMPMAVFSLVYLTDEGPTLQMIFTSDKDYNLWKPIVKEVFQIR